MKWWGERGGKEGKEVTRTVHFAASATLAERGKKGGGEKRKDERTRP